MYIIISKLNNWVKIVKDTHFRQKSHIYDLNPFRPKFSEKRHIFFKDYKNKYIAAYCTCTVEQQNVFLA